MKFRFLLLSCIAATILCITPGNTIAQKKKKSQTSNSDEKKINPWEVDTLLTPIPIGRRLFTDKVEKVIDEIDLKDGTKDGYVNYRDEQTSQYFTQAFMADVPKVIILTENLDIPHNDKVRYHKALEDKLQLLKTMDWNDLPADYFSNMFENLNGLLVAQYKEQVVPFAAKHTTLTTLQNIQLLTQSGVVVSDATEAKAILYKGLAKQYPLAVIERLNEIKDQPYTDTIVADIAQVMPSTIMQYAMQDGPLSGIIKRNADPFVQTIVRIVDGSKTPERLLPFLGPIHREEMRLSEINQTAGNDNLYFQELVNLVVRNEQVCRTLIDEEISRRVLQYARTLNNESLSNDQRFRDITQLRDIDYYLLLVEGKDNLYASSITEGIYPLLIQSLNKKSGKVLLAQFNNYKFRTFIRLCATHDLLDAFLRTMTPSEKDQLFKAFSDKLEEGDIHDMIQALEVVSTFPYIKNEDFSDQVKSDADFHYSRVKENNNEQTAKGILTYGIMKLLFYQEEAGDKPLEEVLGLDAIRYIPYENFLNSLNEIVEQVYFSPDATGRKYYTDFLKNVKANSAWDVQEQKNWIKITSNSSKKITIYTNTVSNDSLTQLSLDALNGYMNQNNIQPVILFHCAPIDYLPKTISNVHATTQIVVAGQSFGDENLLALVRKNPRIHLLSSSHPATPDVEISIFNELNKQLLYGRNLNWKDMWKDLNSYFTNNAAEDKPVFDQQIRPDQNLALLFAKTYLQTLDKQQKK